jgi:hypothetical protein
MRGVQPERPDLRGWKLFVRQFEFLQSDHIDRIRSKPLRKMGQPHPQGIHIPGGDAHHSKSALA